MQEGDLNRTASKDTADKARRAAQAPRLQMFEDYLNEQQRVLDQCPEIKAVEFQGILSKPGAEGMHTAAMGVPTTVLTRK